MAARTAAWPGEEGLVDIRLGRRMGRGALDQPGARHAHLGVRDAGLDDLGERLAGAAELGVAEGVGRRIRREVVAVRVDESLGDDDQAVALALEDALHVLQDLLLVEGDLGKEDQVRGVVGMVAALRQGGAGGDPAGAAPHDLDDRDQVALAHRLVVAGDLADGHREVLDHAAVARAVVRAGQVVVDRLRDADHPELVALLLGQLGDLVGGVLGVVAPDVEEIADVVGLEDLDHALEVLLLLELVAAGPEGRPGRVAQGPDLLLRLRGQVDDVLLEDAQDPVEAAVNFLDGLVVERLGHDSGQARVDDRGRTARLTHQYVSYEFSHLKSYKGLERTVRVQESASRGSAQLKSSAGRNAALKEPGRAIFGGALHLLGDRLHLGHEDVDLVRRRPDEARALGKDLQQRLLAEADPPVAGQAVQKVDARTSRRASPSPPPASAP